ncbi:2-succinyl-5-enolpyruvyl-6-hydroxy-3-cyclohexene-1-carboxylic-acid synthase [Antrihabitans stalactiti]|uniref:2-succinyl-5-enolpyruvyl-6-hydroxy-3-cyclohexene-1-carboxylate synthase n=1 Tax=Antrihabitans stalactiti TaxID=2584121 RepID=A0A848K8I0_9NOCA|nr:2-succinyl-5-enolpyruvyl-6-hydroxy-3-cyclohexene-1-carboxylic-acid synthase [Antrihabitans stalactiti]
MTAALTQASVIVDELIRCGVRDAVLCPGSRNAPLAFALHRADAEGKVRLHVRIDERSAAFLALGLATATARLVPIITTSGSAVVNLAPGILEASYANLPLMVVSANRPGELLGTGASQMILQSGVFGAEVRAEATLSQADYDYPPDSQRLVQHNIRWRATICRLAASAHGLRDGHPGPVHLDVPFAEPLVGPQPVDVPLGRDDGGPWTAIEPARMDAPVTVDLTLNTLVITGHGAREIPELAGVPTIAEPSAPAVSNAVHPHAIAHLAPQQVVVVGRPTLHRQVVQLLSSPAVRIVVIAAEKSWTDVSGTANAVGRSVRVVGRSAVDWLQMCERASDIAYGAVGRALDSVDETTGLHVARALTRQLVSGDTLVIGSSNPIRDIALTWKRPCGVTVVANRGVAGIDGLVSTAVGAAIGSSGRTIALLGDLTFAHDSGGMLAGPSEPMPKDLTIVVANDNGGGIFSLLEQGDPAHADVFERVFGTPHETDFGQLCGAHGIPHQIVTEGELVDVLARKANSSKGLRVVEVRTSRVGLRDLHGEIRKEIEAEMSGYAQSALARE